MSTQLELFLEDNPHLRPEPPPINAGEDVWLYAIKRAPAYVGGDEVPEGLIKAMQDRRLFGIAKYGQPLLTGDGRETMSDMFDEALDGYAYAMKNDRQKLTYESFLLVREAYLHLRYVWTYKEKA